MTVPAFVADRSPRGLIVARGDDATSFLQSLVSQDLGPLGDGDHAPALLLTPQGKLDVAFRILRTGDEWWLDTDADYAPRLLSSLNRFRIRVKVDLDDRTATTGLVSTVGVPGDTVPGGVHPLPAGSRARRRTSSNGARRARPRSPASSAPAAIAAIV